ncbi:MAG: PD40 domain-containing protein [Opitutaceae bacterium]|nr:PD40 domain-containing protein [Cytophagales bacterium]
MVPNLKITASFQFILSGLGSTLFLLTLLIVQTDKVFGQTARDNNHKELAKGNYYLSKLSLPNDKIKHTNDAVVMLSGSDSIFYFSQKAAPSHHITEFHFFLFQKKTAQEIKVPFAPGSKTDRLICVDKENKTLFFDFDVNGDDIYYSKSIGGKWQKPMPFAPLNSRFKESGMCISPDKKKIIFASNRGNENLNLDLFLTEYQEDGLWRKPQLLRTLSSDQDEDDPRFSPDGKTLFFASKGFKGFGKYDLFSSAYDSISKSWGTPVNLGRQVNSEYNEISPCLNQKGILALFSSDRFSVSEDYRIYRPVTGNKTLFSAQVNSSDSSLQIANLILILQPEDALPGDDQKKIISETGVYADTVYFNRWYLLSIMDSNNVLHSERILLTTSTSNRTYYLDLNKIKDPHLIYEGKKIPRLTKYIFRYDANELLPEKYNKKTLERVAELLSHLHIYKVEILYPSKLTKEQLALVSARVEGLKKYLLKNKASQQEISVSKLSTLAAEQLSLKMEFKPHFH